MHHPLRDRLIVDMALCDRACKVKSVIADCMCATVIFELDRLYNEVKRLELLQNPNVVILSDHRKDQ